MKKIIEAIIKWFKNLRVSDIVVYLVSVALLATVISLFASSNRKLSEQLNTANNNNAAYQMRIEGQNSQIAQFELSVGYLRHCNDSVSVKLVETIDKLNVSEKKLKEANYMLSHFAKTDTVVVRDTIFKEPDFSLDTVVGDRWVSTRLELSYPSTIVVTPSVVSEKKVLIYSSREIQGTPSKCFFVRWFQKKHIVTKVEIDESNPYIISEENVYIKTND